NTLVNSALPASYQASGGLTSPVNGTVTLWRVLSTTSAQGGFQVVHPLGGGLFTGGGSTPIFVIPGNVLSTYALAVPIRIGDYIGIISQFGLRVATSDPAPHFLQWQPPLPDVGPPSMPVTDSNGDEVAFNGDINQTNAFTLGSATRDKKRGTATLTVNVPNPGQLSAAGKGVSASAANSGKAVAAPGPATLLVRATGKQRK